MQATLEAPAVDPSDEFKLYGETAATLRADVGFANSPAEADANAAADAHGLAVATAVALGLAAGVIAALLMMLGYATT